MIKTVASLVILFLLLQSCDIQKKSSKNDFDIKGVEEYTVLKDTITLMVLSYAPAQECNDSIRWLSTCFGLDIKTDEIIKVVTECNTDTTINKGDFVEVIPQVKEKDRSYKVITSAVMIKEHREYKYSPLYKLQVKTVYGYLVKNNIKPSNAGDKSE